jgi:hypothetical protein
LISLRFFVGKFVKIQDNIISLLGFSEKFEPIGISRLILQEGGIISSVQEEIQEVQYEWNIEKLGFLIMIPLLFSRLQFRNWFDPKPKVK